MRDKNLIVLNQADCTSSSLVDGTGLIGAFVLVSDAIPFNPPLGGVLAGASESIALHVTCSATFVEAATCNVTLRLISTNAAPADIVTAYLTANFFSHWESPAVSATAFKAGRRMYTIPLPPTREYFGNLYLIGLFSGAAPGDGLDSGRLTAFLAPIQNMAHYPPADAVSHK